MTKGNEKANQLDFTFYQLDFKLYRYYSPNNYGNIKLFEARAYISNKRIKRADQLDFIF